MLDLLSKIKTFQEEEGEEYGKKMNKVIKDNMKLKSKIEDIEDEEENYDMCKSIF